uniref:GPR180-like N-terminal domain-containing protein n=1 Tax=Acrobeloides nanus TaxID=290746 RepID=A0A914EC04_9BILA
MLPLSKFAFFGAGDFCSTFEDEKTNETWYKCIGERRFTSMRPRWWYLAIGNCDSVQGLYMEYRKFFIVR